ncbi:MAG: PilX N-terminal domain-containing pilus assembly protein, partial [Verrucomicrobiota bacterium]
MRPEATYTPVKENRHERNQRGVALVTTMVILAVMAIVAVALMQGVTTDRSSARSGANYYRAVLAADAGVAAAGTMMVGQMTNDHFIVVANTNGQLFVGNGSNQSAGFFAYRPMFSFTNSLSDLLSSTSGPIVTNRLPLTNVAGGVYFTNTNMPGGLSMTSPAVAWIYLTNSSGRTNARFAFWVEDLGGKLDLSLVGSTSATDTNARRPTGTNPAEIALWSVFNPGSASDPGNAGATALTTARSNIFTAATARLASPAVTTNIQAELAVGLRQDANEPEVIPFGFGYADAGKPKYNLNT